MEKPQTWRMPSALATLALLVFMPSVGAAQSAGRQVSTLDLRVDWEQFAIHPSLSWERLTEAQQEAVRRSTVPVLLPGELVGLDGQISVGHAWYGASFGESNGHDPAVFIHGTTRVILVDGERPDLPMLQGDIAPTRGEGIVEVAFESFGAVYNVSIECSDQHDRRCTDNVYILGMTGGLLAAVPVD